MGDASEKKTYCVTGASGYIGSWLVKSLLQRGHQVHATVRDPEKSKYLLKKWEGEDRVKLFRADLLEEGSYEDAVRGCCGIFHVAAPMEFQVSVKEEGDDIDSYVQNKVMEPAIRGTLNVLKACLNSSSVRRVVFTSSISTLTAKDQSSEEEWIPVVDESCKNPIDLIWRKKPSGWVYVLVKLLTEEAALRFSQENGIDMVSVITTTVAGSFITSRVPSSIKVLLSPITGDPQLFQILVAVNSRMGSIGLVHIEDICSAHIFLMEHPEADQGSSYLCCTQSLVLSELVNLLKVKYPYCSNLDLERLGSEKIIITQSVPSEISSKKLRDLGFNYKYGIEDIIGETVVKCMDCEFLPTSCKTVQSKIIEQTV